jgi:hypothetical protein
MISLMLLAIMQNGSNGKSMDDGVFGPKLLKTSIRTKKASSNMATYPSAELVYHSILFSRR